MTAFALIHGAGDSGWYRHLVELALRERGYDVVARRWGWTQAAGAGARESAVCRPIELIGPRHRWRS